MMYCAGRYAPMLPSICMPSRGLIVHSATPTWRVSFMSFPGSERRSRQALLVVEVHVRCIGPAIPDCGRVRNVLARQHDRVAGETRVGLHKFSVHTGNSEAPQF